MGTKILIALLGSCLLYEGSMCTNLKFSPVIQYLRERSDPDILPALINESNPLKVDVTVNLVNINEVDTQNDQVDLTIWQSVSWEVSYIAWNMSEPGFNVSSINVPVRYLWVPDLTIYNNLLASQILTPPIALVSYQGNVHWIPSLRVRIPCNLRDIHKDSGASCSMKLGSWTYNGLQLTLTDPLSSGFNLNELHLNSNYDVLDANSRKETIYYSCCPEPYESITLTFAIRKRQNTYDLSDQ